MFTNLRQMTDESAIDAKKVFTDIDLAVLIEIWHKESYRKIAPKIHKSLGVVQFHVRWLEKNEYIVKVRKGWHPFGITEKGMRKLRDNGYVRGS